MRAHTTPWSFPEREVRTACSVVAIRRETLRVKGRWTLPENRVAVSKILTRKHQRSSRNVVSGDLIVLECRARDSPDWWVQAHCFLEHHACVVQRGKVFHGGRTPSEPRSQLSLERVLDPRVLGEQVPGP